MLLWVSHLQCIVFIIITCSVSLSRALTACLYI